MVPLTSTAALAAHTERTKFQSPFPPLYLSLEDAVQLENVAHTFVRNTIAQLEMHEHHARRVVDLSRWKLVTRREGVSVYVERCIVDPAKPRRRRSHFQQRSRCLDDHDRYTGTTTVSRSQYGQETESTVATDSPASGGSVSTSCRQHPRSLATQTKTIARPDLPVFLAVGTLEGTLEDAMYGAVTSGVDAMRTRTAFVLDKLTDAAVLATLIAPTPQEPFRTLSVKWVEKRPVSSRVSVLDKLTLAGARDAVVLESTGMAQLPNGERVGYLLLHSVHFPQTQLLPSTTRSNVSVCCIWHQQSPTSLGLFLKSYTSLPSSNALVRAVRNRVAARSVLSVCKYVEWGRTKKLVGALEQLYKCPVGRVRDSSGGDASNNKNTTTTNDDNDDIGGDGADHMGGASSACSNGGGGDMSPKRTSACTNCKKRPRRRHRIFHRRSMCRPKCKLCLQYVCRSCSITKTLGYVAADGRLQYNDATLCGLCIHVAMVETETVAVASQEVARSMELLRLSPLPPLQPIATTSSMAVSDYSLFDHATPW